MEEMLDKFGDYLMYERRYSPHTVKAYITDLEDFFRHYRAEAQTDDMMAADVSDVRRWMADMRQQGRAAVTINRKISTLRSFYKWLMKAGVVGSSPVEALQNLKKPRKLPEFVPEAKMDELLDNDGLFAGDPDGVRNRLILELFYDTGVRETELINIKCKDVDGVSLTITVHGKGGKTRVVPISGDLFERLKVLMTAPESYLFLTGRGRQMYPKLVYRVVHRYLETTGSVSRSSPHVLRHSFATALLNNGAELNAIKELLGHANLNATQIYTHTTYKEINKLYNQAHPRANKNKEEIMNVTIEAIHFNADARLEEFIQEKVSKLTQVADDIIKAEVFLSLERSQSKNYDSKVAKIRVEVPGGAIFAEKKSATFEESTDTALEALRVQLLKRKEKHQ